MWQRDIARGTANPYRIPTFANPVSLPLIPSQPQVLQENVITQVQQTLTDGPAATIRGNWLVADDNRRRWGVQKGKWQIPSSLAKKKGRPHHGAPDQGPHDGAEAPCSTLLRSESAQVFSGFRPQMPSTLRHPTY